MPSSLLGIPEASSVVLCSNLHTCSLRKKTVLYVLSALAQGFGLGPCIGVVYYAVQDQYCIQQASHELLQVLVDQPLRSSRGHDPGKVSQCDPRFLSNAKARS